MAESTLTSTHSSKVSEESLNQMTHGIGLGLSILGAVHLLAQTDVDAVVRVGCWIYAVALVALFAASTLSHSFESDPHRTRYRTLDQICIFTVMAATYTPISLYVCPDGLWNLPLVMIWLMAVTGIILKLYVTGSEMVPVWFYVVLGLIPMLASPRLLQFLGPEGMFWVVAGGLCYVVGVLFLTNDHRSRFFHPIWHILVMLGSTCHYIVISEYAAGTG
ncbi:MAG: hemolysin III family protein [Fuerstiella sp.]